MPRSRPIPRRSRFKIKSGVKFSPPVNREVTSSDVKYAIERGLLPGVANGYEEAYFSAISGFKEAQAAAKKDPTVAPDISGITTPDPHTIVFQLDRPVAKTYFVQALSLPLSAPVPEDYAKKFDAQNPSGYGTHVVSTGPYMIENNSSGTLTGYSPGKEIKLVRNPNWDASTDWRPGVPRHDRHPGGVLRHGLRYEEDPHGEQRDQRRLRLAGRGAQVGRHPVPGPTDADPDRRFPHVALNMSKPPFDNINVRKAVIANSDREALRATRGGISSARSRRITSRR